jgi:hypothetical protein
MTANAAANAERLTSRADGPLVVLGEIAGAQGIADIVAVRFNTEAILRRVDNEVGPITSALRMRCLDLLRRDRPMRIETLATKLGTNARAITRSTLTPLAQLGVVELAPGLVRSTGAWEPVCDHISAIELKLSKWRAALRQADNLARSADRSWVVLDEAQANGALQNIDAFAAFGVGLALLSREGKLQIVVSPRGRRPTRWLRALMAENAWAATLDSPADSLLADLWVT